MRISSDKINWRVAAGEVLLIVVGILLALAIDSWAERRKDLAQADVYLNDIALELTAELQRIEANREQLGQLVESARRLLNTLNTPETQEPDPGGLLIGSVFGEGVTRQSAIWQELQMTGALRLIPNPDLRSAIVSHYLGQAGRYNVIDANFMPAVRDLRALAWDLMPIDSFQHYWKTRESGVPAQAVLEKLRARNDAVYLLKRLIMTATVAQSNLERASESTTQ
ncbi:MAG: hypothetical protein HKN49_09945, partial [Gammaproteobacteria bacterium]|nr:hypothetical protein [Gammaproteobacteria bacterium]